jgi:hypothetical protein
MKKDSERKNYTRLLDGREQERECFLNSVKA